MLSVGGASMTKTTTVFALIELIKEGGILSCESEK